MPVHRHVQFVTAGDPRMHLIHSLSGARTNSFYVSCSCLCPSERPAGRGAGHVHDGPPLDHLRQQRSLSSPLRTARVHACSLTEWRRARAAGHRRPHRTPSASVRSVLPYAQGHGHGMCAARSSIHGAVPGTPGNRRRRSDRPRPVGGGRGTKQASARLVKAQHRRSVSTQIDKQ